MKKNKIITMVLAAALTSSSATSILAYAEVTANSNKEEVIYINLNDDGSVEGTYAVNIFEDKNIIDYGQYSSIKNMNTVDKLSYNNGEVTGNNSGEKLYYEGVMENIEIPWNVNIKYYIDGKEISGEDLAGQSGALEIKIDIKENEKCNEIFFNNYALQATVLLDGSKCSNIKAEGATEANVGSNKQLSYIVLPGKGSEISISTEVKDFEMDAIAINGVKLNLNIDTNTDELMDKVTELQAAIEKINTGTNLLSEGTGSLSEGAVVLDKGIGSLSSGARSLNDGIGQVQQGLEALNSNSGDLVNGSEEVLNALNIINEALNNVAISSENITMLIEAANGIQAGIDTLVQGIGSLQSSINYEGYKNIMATNGANIEYLQASNNATISSLQGQIATLEEQKIALLSSGLTEADVQVITLNESINLFKQMITLIQGNCAVIAGTETYFNSVSSGVSELYDGAITLQGKYAEFNSALGALVNTLNGLVYNMNELSAAINTLTSEYSTLDNGINTYTEGVQALLAGYSKVVSGATELVNGTSELKAGSATLTSGAETLNSKTTELASGTNELNEQTNTLDTQLSEKIDDTIAEISGNGEEVQSFVSDKNTNIKSVQFVIKTEAIKKQESINTETIEENISLWQKIINLFK